MVETDLFVDMPNIMPFFCALCLRLYSFKESYKIDFLNVEVAIELPVIPMEETDMGHFYVKTHHSSVTSR